MMGGIVLNIKNVNESFFHLLLQMQRFKVDKLVPRLKTHELAILYIIDSCSKDKGGAYVSEIAEALGIPASGVSRILRRLEDELCYITRTADSNDRRNTLVSFTKKGKKSFDRDKSFALGIATKIFNYLTPEEQVQYLELSKKLKNASDIVLSKLSNSDE